MTWVPKVVLDNTFRAQYTFSAPVGSSASSCSGSGTDVETRAKHRTGPGTEVMEQTSVSRTLLPTRFTTGPSRPVWDSAHH